MSRKEISISVRELIIKLHKEGKSYAEIGNTVGRSRYSIRNVVCRFKNEHRIDNSRRTGRPRKLTDREERDIKRIVKKIHL